MNRQRKYIKRAHRPKVNKPPTYTVKKLAIKSNNGRAVVQITFNNAKNITRNGIASLANKTSDEMKKKLPKGSMISVCLRYPEKWRSGPWTPLGEPVKLWSEKKYDKPDPIRYPAFLIFIRQSGETEGGCNSTNSCFYDSLVRLLPEEDIPWKSDEEMKKYLELKPNDKVPIKKMDMVQKKLPKDYKLMITGDHIYTSTNRSKHELKIQLNNAHYEPKELPKLVYGIPKTEKIPCIYIRRNDGDYDICTPKKKEIMKNDEFMKHWKKPLSSKYVLIHYDVSKGSLEDDMKAFLEKADIYKKKTNGMINFYKTGCNRRTILNLFDSLNKNLTVDHIEQDESDWILKATQGSIIRCEPYTGPGHQYDIVSMYPSIMKNSSMTFPIKRGSFIEVSQEEFKKMEDSYFKYGIYHCKIEEDSSKRMLFRWNPTNYYTHFDLKAAKILGLKISIFEGANALLWETDRINGNNLFGKYFDKMFPLKQDKLPESKTLNNMLWGLLTQKDTFIINYESQKGCVLHDEREIHSITPKSLKNIDDLKLKIFRRNRVFKTNYARIGPFLLAKARLKICEIMLPYANQIVRVHTDGFISKEKLENIRTGTNLGDLKYEGHYEKVDIINNTNIKGDLITSNTY